MPFSTSIVDRRTAEIGHRVDARWEMAYAAGIGGLDPRMMDTASHSRVVAHPVLPVCVEWPVLIAASQIPGSESRRWKSALTAFTRRTTCAAIDPILADDGNKMTGPSARLPEYA
jgi:hypothetical protein